MKKIACFRPELVLFLSCFFFVISSFAQNAISGRIVDEKKAPIIGATVSIKNTKLSTRTDEQGEFHFNNVSNSNVVLIITSIGYEKKEVSYKQGQDLAISLTEVATVGDEVVVTGVFDKRKKMEASVAITTLNDKQMSKIIPASAADLLKNVPGVYVNSSLGEIRNTVYSRGVSVGSNDGASGYYYVSMQEDGLPVTNATYGNYGPDYFLRPDATLGRLEAVKGGTASILGANAPGGIFNYIMKEGGTTTSGEVRTKYGLEGNGHNNFYRTDFNIGGPVGNNWFWNAGGFFRYDQGARYPGYPINNGGKFKGNIVKKYATGSLKIYAKYLNDHNGWYEFTPTLSYTDPKPAPGFNDHSSVLSAPVRQSFPYNQSGQLLNYNTPDLIHSTDKSAGLNWEQHFGEGWTFNNALRYSDKRTFWNTNAIVYPMAFDDLVSYAILGALGQPGTYHFRKVGTGQELMTVQSFSGYDFNVLQSNLPGSDVAKNSLFFEPMLYADNKVKELLDQFSLTKKFNTSSITFGGFYGRSKIDRISGAAGNAFGTIQDRPELIDITRTNPDGSIAHITNSNGVEGVGVGFGGVASSSATQSQMALFFGHNWQITSALNLDWGIRFEKMKVKGQNTPATTATDAKGGVDGDPLTIFDNVYGVTGSPLPFDKTINTFSYSAGLNYKFNNHFSVYGRYSEGNKAPDLDIYFNANSEFTSKTLNPEAQKVRQFELGLKSKTKNFNLFVTPFFSFLSNVPTVQTFQNPDNSLYSPPTQYAKYRTYGVELESDYQFDQHWNLRGVFTFQKAKAIDYNVWLANNPGAADDSLTSYSGNEVDNIARAIFSITPSYNANKFYSFLTWSFMGKRQANVANAFLLPSFSQFNFGAGYDFSKHFQLAVNVNNILNTYGVMSWSRPGSFLQALDRQGFTKEMYEDAVKNNTPYSTISIQPRAFFVTATFKF
jgi:outer membrane receptor protein involved in Fe transport